MSTTPIKIAGVISDADGTLVTADKTLTDGAVRAVAALRARGIAFAIISSRSPRGLRMLLEPLDITTPVAGFNGGVLATPSGDIIESHLLPPATARRAVEMIEGHGAEAWVFGGQDWFARDAANSFVPREEHTLGFAPTIVTAFGAALDTAAKIVGVSGDAPRLAACARDVHAVLGREATVACSQPYYLDITPRAANKGDGAAALAGLIGVPLAEIAVIGDAENDVAMFTRAGLSIAMGNATPSVKAAADLVTDGNDDEGFAKAITRFIIAGQRPGAEQIAQARSRRGAVRHAG